MRHCPTSLCSSNGQMLWPSRIRDEHLHVFQWILPAFIQHNNVNYLRWGTIYLKNPSNFTRNLDRAWGSKFGVNHSSHQSNQLDLDQKYEWLDALVQREGCNRNHHQVLDLLSLRCTWFQWLCWACVQNRWKHVSRTPGQNCVVITVHETLFYTLM